MTAILERMYRDATHRAPFIATLPIAGKEGRHDGHAHAADARGGGNAVAKTGSIANVRSLSGYVRTRDGEMLVFSILANDFVIPAATVNWIADLAVEHLANFTRRATLSPEIPSRGAEDRLASPLSPPPCASSGRPPPPLPPNIAVNA